MINSTICKYFCTQWVVQGSLFPDFTKIKETLLISLKCFVVYCLIILHTSSKLAMVSMYRFVHGTDCPVTCTYLNII